MSASRIEVADEEIRRALGERHVAALERLREGLCEVGDGQLFFEVLDYILAKEILH